MPIIQLGLSGEGLSEQSLFDYGVNFIRTRLVTIPGCSIPYPYGGKQREIMVDINPAAMQSKGLSPADITDAISKQNLIIPAGTSKIGQFEYDVDLNSSPATVDAFNNFPVKMVNGSPIYIRDIGYVRDGFAPQTNIVRQDGRRGVLLTVMKAGNASTLAVVDGIRKLLPRVSATLPPQLKIQPLADQSIFVRASISGVIREAVTAAVSDRIDDSGLPWKLAEHADHRYLYSALDTHVTDCAQLPARNHQHYDARRLGPGSRNPGRRRHRRRLKISTGIWTKARKSSKPSLMGPRKLLCPL